MNNQKETPKNKINKILYNIKKNLNGNFFIIINGPTGVGKTDFIYDIDISINQIFKKSIEVINADTGQLYKPLSIGTAKPDIIKEKNTHHLFNLIDKPIDYTAANYRIKVQNLIKSIWVKDKIPVIVGGSSFYIKSLLFKPKKVVLNQDNLKNINKINLNGFSTSELWHKLFKIDYKRAQQIHINDRYRIERALNIWNTTGILPSEQKNIYDPIGSFCFLFLTRDRKELYNRINKRVDQMFSEGWIEEVKSLDKDWIDFLKYKKLIGYPEIIEYLSNNNEISFERLIEKIKQNTRKYAKRQLTFWRTFSKDLEMHIKKWDNQSYINEIDLS